MFACAVCCWLVSRSGDVSSRSSLVLISVVPFSGLFLYVFHVNVVSSVRLLYVFCRPSVCLLSVFCMYSVGSSVSLLSDAYPVSLLPDAFWNDDVSLSLAAAFAATRVLAAVVLPTGKVS